MTNPYDEFDASTVMRVRQSELAMASARNVGVGTDDMIGPFINAVIDLSPEAVAAREKEMQAKGYASDGNGNGLWTEEEWQRYMTAAANATQEAGEKAKAARPQFTEGLLNYDLLTEEERAKQAANIGSAVNEAELERIWQEMENRD